MTICFHSFGGALFYIGFAYVFGYVFFVAMRLPAGAFFRPKLLPWKIEQISFPFYLGFAYVFQKLVFLSYSFYLFSRVR